MPAQPLNALQRSRLKTPPIMDWAICRACVGPFGCSSSLSVLVKTLNGKKIIENARRTWSGLALWIFLDAKTYRVLLVLGVQNSCYPHEK